jgi:hypothetical protein
VLLAPAERAIRAMCSMADRGKRFSIYVPAELVPDIQKAVDNGRHLRDLINEAGVRYAHAIKAQRKKQS